MFLYLFYKRLVIQSKVKQKFIKMTVPKKLQDRWRSLYSAGDFEAISKASGYSTVTIRSGFNSGECSEKVFEAIAGFYKDREEMVNEYLK